MKKEGFWVKLFFALLTAALTVAGQKFIMTEQNSVAKENLNCSRITNFRNDKIKESNATLKRIRELLNETDIDIQGRADRLLKGQAAADDGDQRGVEQRTQPKLEEVKKLSSELPAELEVHVLRYVQLQLARLSVFGSAELYRKLGDHWDTERRRAFDSDLEAAKERYGTLEDLPGCK